jgi:Fe-S oxidoreductase
MEYAEILYSSKLPSLTVKPVYDILSADLTKKTAPCAVGTEVSVHDPCPLRDDLHTQGAIRRILAAMGYAVVEMKHHGRRTVCCGEGGGVGAVKPEFAEHWATIRKREAGQRNIVTYCSGCTSYLNRVAPTVHIADLLYQPETVMNGHLTVPRPPFTYWNRLVLKHRLKKLFR